ncbi:MULTISPECIES: hypothetical protein [Sphingomonas]|uniref:hypothetical protein n=1 Tax=Sphingomonas TaxID=13687 RepID=UPI00092916FB|nr:MULTISPECIES: hypothetical protein [Sphingomonas]MCW6530086.1 hypothetical protein [Sphingomonas lycopersici]OJU18965.1 MAG: hypothetical protein BGN95_01825 [Sphingomonas sp. 66-10]
MSTNLAPIRRFIQPESGDDWPAIAARVLPDEPAEAAIEQLKSWNLHLVFRPVSVITPSDIVFVEPPRAVAA